MNFKEVNGNTSILVDSLRIGNIKCGIVPPGFISHAVNVTTSSYYESDTYWMPLWDRCSVVSLKLRVRIRSQVRSVYWFQNLLIVIFSGFCTSARQMSDDSRQNMIILFTFKAFIVFGRQIFEAIKKNIFTILFLICREQNEVWISRQHLREIISQGGSLPVTKENSRNYKLVYTFTTRYYEQLCYPGSKTVVLCWQKFSTFRHHLWAESSDSFLLPHRRAERTTPEDAAHRWWRNVENFCQYKTTIFEPG